METSVGTIYSEDAKQIEQRSVLLETTLTYAELLQWFLEYGIEFFVCGGHSIAAFGMPNRTTNDLDIQVRRSPENLAKIRTVLSGLKLTQGELQTIGKDCTFVRIYSPDGEFDIGYHLHGMSFERAYESAIDIELFGLTVKSINLWNMCIVKLVVQIANFHVKHWADIEWMKSQIIL